ncbi:unnamed protein product [Phaeothamnion confervicola]
METAESANAQGEATVSVGQHYNTSEDVRYYVEDYLLAGRRGLTSISSAGRQTKYDCTGYNTKDRTGYTFRAYATQQAKGEWKISKVVDEHENCAAVPKASSAAIAAMLESHARQQEREVHAGPGIAQAAGFEADRRHVNNAKLRVKDMALGEDDSYQLMEPFLKAFAEKNPGSVSSVDKDEEWRFKRCYIVPNACAVGACRTESSS